MKRGLVILGAVAWIVAAATFTAAWSAHRRGPKTIEQQPTQILPAKRPLKPEWPIHVTVDAQLPFSGSWMRSVWRLSRNDNVHVQSDIVANGLLRVVIDDCNGFSWDIVTIWLQDMGDTSVQADAEVEWTKDFGPPFDGFRDDVNGTIKISSADWSGTTALILSFDLHGADSAEDQWRDQGVVGVSR